MNATAVNDSAPAIVTGDAVDVSAFIGGFEAVEVHIVPSVIRSVGEDLVCNVGAMLADSSASVGKGVVSVNVFGGCCCFGFE